MRVLLTSFPAYGHLHPVVPLGLAAQAQGHDVRVATGPNLTEWVRACGLEPVVVGMSEDDLARTADRDFAGPERTGRMFNEVWVLSAMPDLLSFTSSWRPDVVVHEEEEYAGVLLAAVLGVPCVTQSWSAPARPAQGQALALELLAKAWQQYLPGVPPRRVGELYLDACPAAFQTADLHEIARTARVVAVQPGLYDGPPTDPPDFLRDLPRPSAYVTLGTVAVFSTPALLRSIAEALSPVVASVVLTTGPNPAETVGQLPGNVWTIAYVPQSLVLPAVDLMVSHGGAGGTAGALMHGLPHLVLPGLGTSQQTVARAVQATGTGLRLAEDQRSAELIASAAATLLADPAYAAAAEAMGDTLRELPGPAEMVALLPLRASG